MKWSFFDDWIIPMTLDALISNEVKKLKISKAIAYVYLIIFHLFKFIKKIWIYLSDLLVYL